MTEWIVTSGVLILAVLLLRFLLKDRISGRLRYSLWLLVLIRLLLPLSLPSGISIMNLLPAEKPEQLTVGYVDYELPDLSVEEPDPSLPQALRQAVYEENLQQYRQILQQAKEETGTPVTLGQILVCLWILGMAVTGCILVFSNCRFALKLKKDREKLDCADSPVEVYITDRIETPCLFGLFRPAIYLTPELRDPQTLQHVLLHELTHRRHWDHIWSALRCVCLVLHWYHPLVWVAAIASKQDAEVACDEAVIRQLGEEQRTAYGKTLISMTCTCRSDRDLLVAATTMVSGKRALKERVMRIAKHPKTALYALIAVVLVAAVAVGCTFTGAESPTEPPEDEKVYVTEIYKDSLYVYEKEGFGGEFFIRLHSNGTFAYSTGPLSSYYGTGTWSIQDGILTISDDAALGHPCVNRFRITEEALIWQEQSSSGFLYLTLEDGDKFMLTAEETDSTGGESTLQPEDPMTGGIVNMGGVGYQYVGRHDGPMPEGYTFTGTIYRDVTGVPSGDYAASVIIGGCRLYTSSQDPDTAYVCNPEGYGSEFILKMERIKEKLPLPTALNEKELLQLQSTLSWGGYLRCMNVPFYDLQQLDLQQLVTLGGITAGKPTTQAELDFVRSRWGALAQEVAYQEVIRVPVSELNAFLDTYYACTLNAFTNDSMVRNSLVDYLEETDSYYLYRNDTQPETITVTSGIRYGGQLYVRYLRQGQGYVAKLWDIDGRYVFLNILKEG